jgi:hypothetical protein
MNGRIVLVAASSRLQLSISLPNALVVGIYRGAIKANPGGAEQ